MTALVFNNIQKVSSPKYNGRVSGCEWADSMVSLFVGRIDLGKHVRNGISSANREEPTVQSAVLAHTPT